MIGIAITAPTFEPNPVVREVVSELVSNIPWNSTTFGRRPRISSRR
jgi:hypothetical protein